MALKRIGVLTGGGDAPGLNPAIRALVWKAQEIGMSYRDYVLEILERGRYPQGEAH